ncbi:MAG: SIS domain-containing protein [Candidatus Njordarchaeia archaeon]|nr:SIS domain-containing protein [Candidatus Korarchaeota archaeon]
MSDISAFQDAFKTLIEISRDFVKNKVPLQEENIITAMEMIRKIKEENKYIHVFGMGRSKLVAITFGELLKNIGFKVSVIGATLSKPVRKGDLLIAVSSSGWTNTTCTVTEEALRVGAHVLALTATPGSKLDRLADLSIYVPGKSAISEAPYIVRQLMGQHKTPLTPMGTVPETNSVLVGVGITAALREKKEDLKTFSKSLDLMLNNAENSFRNIMENKDELIQIIERFSKGFGRETPRYYFVGTGISKIAGDFTAIRFQHLSLNVLGLDDWRFRSSGDVLIAISGSGESTIPVIYAEEAKRSNMYVLAFTANQNSVLYRISDNRLLFTDIIKRELYEKIRVWDDQINYVPAFEYAVLITFESIVAQIAKNHDIGEEYMQNLHANIE